MSHAHVTDLTPDTAATPAAGNGGGIGFTLIAAAVASVAVFLVALAGLPPWAMFVGWVTWFTRPASVRQGAYSVVCLWCGLALAVAAQLSIASLAPVVGQAALPITVFAVATLVVGLRSAPVLDNPVAWFLGLIGSFALHASDRLEGTIVLVEATGIGAAAALLCGQLQRRLTG
ncbi:DUF1097 domain-containing protein [Streptomyces poriticola]|uniref:DUF1097 domain-containing protein n=1 Tax=Streptomyces poriticola TaxID=3120506 RepID=UPI002FCE1756